MDASTILLALGGASGIGLIIRQIRIGLRDRGDRNLLRHIYDQDRRADVLKTLQRLRRNELRLTKQALDAGNTDVSKTVPPRQLPNAGASE